MKKILLLSLFIGISFGANNHRLDLLEQAVSKLIIQINQNQQKINELEHKIYKYNNFIHRLSHQKNNFKLYAIIRAYRLNIRKEATIKSKIIGVYKKSDIVEIINTIRIKDSLWLQTKQGYINANYVNMIIEKGTK